MDIPAEIRQSVIASLPELDDITDVELLCHDVGKPFEFDPDNQRRWKADPASSGFPAIRHADHAWWATLRVAGRLDV